LLFSLVRALAGALVLAHPLVQSAAPAAAAAEAPSDTSAAIPRVVELTNIERGKSGLAPLAFNPQLSQAAQRYSEVLSRDACFAHTCGPVPDMANRIDQAGYGGWTAIGENIAAGYQTPEAVVAGWMQSPGHRANILSPNYREIGVGLAGGGKFGAYWTQEFGTRPGSSPAFQPLPALEPAAAPSVPPAPEPEAAKAPADE
jgi:uncharacterized protein YkwD